MIGTEIERDVQERIAKGNSFCVIYLDLNGFKRIGHLSGAEFLKQFADELRSLFRPVDSLGRRGVDEFTIVFDGTRDEADAAARKAAQWLSGAYRVKSAKIMVTAAVGVAEWDGKESAAELLERADANMYRRKHAWAS